MTNQQLLAIAVFIGVIALFFLVATLIHRREDGIRRRLTRHIVAVETHEGRRLERIDVLKEKTLGAVPSQNPLVGHLRPSEAAGFELVRAGFPPKIRRYLMARVVFGMALVVVAFIVGHNVLYAIPAGLLGGLLPRLWLRRKGQQRVKAFEAQLAEAIDLLVGALRAGHGFLQGLASVVEQVSDPAKFEISQVIDEINVGIAPDDALVAMSNRVPSYDLGLLVSAISVQRQTGGNLAEVLENLAATVRERRRVRGEVMALTTGPRVSSYVLASIPVVLFAYFYLISSEYRRIMVHSTYGHILLAMAAVLSFIGFITSRKVAVVEY